LLRCALIGCGKIGSEFADDESRVGIYSHAGAYKACPDTELVAVCDADQERRDRCAARWNVGAAFADYRELLGQGGFDMVSVCTPDGTHEAVIDAAIESPGLKAILAEKPLAMSVAAATRLAARAIDKGILLAVNYSRRFAPSHRSLSRWLREGNIGTIRSVSGNYYGGVVHIATHWFDLARLMVGDVATIQGFPEKNSGDDPSLDMRLTFKGGATGYLHAVKDSEFTVFEMDILGSRGRARILDSGHVFELFVAKESPHYSGYRSLARVAGPEGGMRDLLLHAVNNVAETLKGKESLYCSAEDGVAALNVSTAAIDSSRRGSVPVILSA
jgi:predicted dehydrogenase